MILLTAYSRVVEQQNTRKNHVCNSIDPISRYLPNKLLLQYSEERSAIYWRKSNKKTIDKYYMNTI